MEREIITWLKSIFPGQPPLLVGIGDDAAVIELDSKRMVVTTDAIVDGVHFETAQHSWQRIGHKSVAVNLSDLAAMGASPLAIVITLVLPTGTTLERVKELYAGISPICERWQVSIAGGDTNFSTGPLTISTAAMGVLRADQQPWLCRGAQVGDEILVSGSFGGSILGKHLDFEPRCDLARDIGSRFQVHAATDVSDGLLFNLGVILRASGCGADLDLSAIPISAAAHQLASAAADHQSALWHALYDGEDFELILVVDRDQAYEIMADPRWANQLTRIGTVTESLGIRGCELKGNVKVLDDHGFTHGQTDNQS